MPSGLELCLTTYVLLHLHLRRYIHLRLARMRASTCIYVFLLDQVGLFVCVSMYVHVHAFLMHTNALIRYLLE